MSKKICALLALGLFWAASAVQATVILNDGDYALYDPSETYVVNGVLNADIFGFGFGFTDPADLFSIKLSAPDVMTGVLEYALSSGPDVTGLTFVVDSLSSGGAVELDVFGAATASPVSPSDVYFSMRLFGGAPGEEYSLADFPIIPDFGYVGDGSGDTGGGSDNNGGYSVPAPSPLVLIGLSLLLLSRSRFGSASEQVAV